MIVQHVKHDRHPRLLKATDVYLDVDVSVDLSEACPAAALAEDKFNDRWPQYGATGSARMTARRF